jgi:hypothetical protein
VSVGITDPIGAQKTAPPTFGLPVVTLLAVFAMI